MLDEANNITLDVQAAARRAGATRHLGSLPRPLPRATCTPFPAHPLLEAPSDAMPLPPSYSLRLKYKDVQALLPPRDSLRLNCKVYRRSSLRVTPSV